MRCEISSSRVKNPQILGVRTTDFGKALYQLGGVLLDVTRRAEQHENVFEFLWLAGPIFNIPAFLLAT
jgi:hypothetical protein